MSLLPASQNKKKWLQFEKAKQWLENVYLCYPSDKGYMNWPSLVFYAKGTWTKKNIHCTSFLRVKKAQITFLELSNMPSCICKIFLMYKTKCWCSCAYHLLQPEWGSGNHNNLLECAFQKISEASNLIIMREKASHRQIKFTAK